MISAVPQIPFSRRLVLTGLGLLTALPALQASSLTAEQVLNRALERAAQIESEDHESSFRLRARRISEKLGDDGQVKQREESVYEVFPVEGRWFERMVEKNGRPLSDEEEAEETRRQRRFAEKIRRGKDPDAKRQQVRLDRELVDKYDWKLQPQQALDGRTCYVLAFRPRNDDLPVRNRMDYALNKAEGELWIDTERFEVARVRFELKEKVRLWWGILGAIWSAQGLVERRPVSERTWLPRQFEMYLNGRILFSSLHRREEIHWTDIRPVQLPRAQD